MPVPHFTAVGDLPVGLHPATLQEVTMRFGAPTARRKNISARLEHIYRIAAGTGHLARFVVFGSFVTAKPEPNDVDVFLLMNNSFDAGALAGEAKLLFDHGDANTYFGASVFWPRRIAAFGGEQAALENWQIKRDGNLRGIVEIVGE